MFKLDNTLEISFPIETKTRLSLVFPWFPWWSSFLMPLTCFDLNVCLRLTTLHGGLENLTSLTYLWLYGCMTTLLEDLIFWRNNATSFISTRVWMLEDLRSLMTCKVEGHVFWTPRFVRATKLVLLLHIHVTSLDILDICGTQTTQISQDN